MAELVAEAFLTVLFEKLFEQLASPELIKNSVASKLKELEGKLKKARLLVDDAEDRQLSESSVKEWLDELKHVVFMADDMVEEINNSKKEKKSKRKAVTRAIKSAYQSLAKTVQSEIDLILMELDVLLDRALVLELKHGNSTALNRRSSPTSIAPLREEQHVFGREAEREEILKLLLSDKVWSEDKIGVLPIVGMGGLGKTTLAQLVFDDRRVEEHGFSFKAWVTVSTEFDFCRIMKELLQKVNPGVSNSVTDPNELQRLMKGALRGKSFLVVLDDVWDENYDNWDLLMSNFGAGDRRSRVIVTTRSRDVGSVVKTGPIHELKEVNSDGCWSIFVHHAFNGDANADPRLQAIGRRIVEKCKGLPLAVKSMGGLLRSERNPEKWESILRSHVWSENQGNKVLPSLWLSYRYLPSPLKQCFAYCSLFPQDYKFSKREMVLLWMAEGFLPSDEKEKRTTEEVGEQYFNDLISRSLFQISIRYESKFVMHDLVHDLATFVMSEFGCMFGEDSMNVKCHTTRARYFSCSNGSNEYDFMTSLSTVKRPRTFLASSRRKTYLSDDFVTMLAKKASFLRVLSLFIESSGAHLSLIGDLKHLRYLDLSGSHIEEVPDSICSLVNLQTLLLSNCYFITRLPMEMGRLIKLRHLDTDGGIRLTKMPPKMGNLKELRMLSDFVVGEADGTGFSSLEELGELKHLSGTLHISKLQNVDNIEDVRKANVLRDKAEIKELIVEWEEYSTNTRVAADVLDALRPHVNLEKLEVYSFTGSSFPIWVGETSFSRMVSVKLIRGKSCFLPPLGQLPSLRELYIERFEMVEKIGSEFYGNDHNSSIPPFQCLENLEFRYMNIWKEWSFVGDQESGCFPRLKHLEIRMCPNLGAESLPDCGTLETLGIQQSFESMECFPLDKFPKMESLSLIDCLNLKYVTNSAEDQSLLPSLTHFHIQSCPEMESFPEGGLPKSLKTLEIRECSKLVAKNKNWDMQKVTSLTSLSIENCDEALDSFPEGLLPSSLTSLSLMEFEHLKSLNGDAIHRLKSLTKLSIRDCDELESLPEQEQLPASLYKLDIFECPFIERMYQKHRGHHWHNISHIPKINIGGHTTVKLKYEESQRSHRASSASTNA